MREVTHVDGESVHGVGGARLVAGRAGDEVDVLPALLDDEVNGEVGGVAEDGDLVARLVAALPDDGGKQQAATLGAGVDIAVDEVGPVTGEVGAGKVLDGGDTSVP